MQDSNFQEKVEEILDTPDTTVDYDPADVEQNRVMAVLAYIGILVLAPIFGAKHSKYARFHANQGLVLFIIEVVLGLALSIAGKILVPILPILGLVFNLLSIVIELATLLLAAVGIVNAATGKAKDLPVIGAIKILK